MEFKEFFTWEFITTFAGAMAATGLITQFLKGMLDKVPTRLLAYLIALVVLTAGNLFLGTFSINTFVLSLLNAVIVATATSGTVDAVNSVRK